MILKDKVFVSNMLVTKKQVLIDEKTNQDAVMGFIKHKLTVTVNNHTYKADSVSLTYMNGVANTASYLFNKSIANGASPSDSYTIYNTEIPWVLANDIIVTVTVEEVCDALKLAMETIGQMVVS